MEAVKREAGPGVGTPHAVAGTDMTNLFQHTFFEPSIGLSFSMQPSYSVKDGATDYPSPKE